MDYMKRIFPLVAALLAAALLVVNGCVLFQSTDSYHYLMESDLPIAVRQDAPLVSEAVAVAEPSVGSFYDRRQIVQRVNGPQLRLLTNDLWAQPPGEGVQGVVIDRLTRWGGFTDVVREDRRSDVRYRVTTAIDRLEFDLSAPEPAAEVDILFTVVDTADEGTTALVRYRHRVRRDLSGETSLEYVTTTNEMIAEGVDQLCLAIKDATR